jgi:glycosyltransferase involved in cell wall biosynthesis
MSAKIQYISHHSVLEYDEVKLLSELGFEVYANGAYRDPRGAYTLPRPGIPSLAFNQEFFDLTAKYPAKTELPPELIEPFDVLIFMHNPDALINNWPRIKHKRVIWRTIGQSLPEWEGRIKPLANEGLEIVRYSKMERNLVNYAGENIMIYFYKDPEEFNNWTGHDKRAINFTQSLLGRRDFCHYDEVTEILKDIPGAKVYGGGNEDLGYLNGGDVPFENFKGLLRDCRAYVYGGTWPASYTLSFIEAMMTGIPIVALGTRLAEPDRFQPFHFYEVGEIIQNNVNGFISDSVPELKNYVNLLLSDEGLAKRIGEEGRKTAIELFGREKIAKQWRDYLSPAGDVSQA